MTDPEKESGKQQGFSKEAWAAITAVVVALIGGIVTVATTLLNKQPSPTPSSHSTSTLPGSSLVTSNFRPLLTRTKE